MSVNKCNTEQEFDLSTALFREVERRNHEARHIADTALRLGKTAMHFARVERVPRYDETSRENDAEHSFMLSLVATEIAAAHYPHLDSGLVSQFGTVHDLIELETGDVATFELPDCELADKARAEHNVLEQLCRLLPPFTAALLRRYEAQTELEARFVRMVDKMLPVIVDIIGPGRTVMQEDYGVYTPAQLMVAETKLRQRFEHMFPEPQADHLRAARVLLADMFSDQFSRDGSIAL